MILHEYVNFICFCVQTHFWIQGKYPLFYVLVREKHIRFTSESQEIYFPQDTLNPACLSEINNIDNAEDLVTVMLMFNLLEYSRNYYITLISLWNYFRDEVNDDANENNTDNYKINNNKATTSKSF